MGLPDLDVVAEIDAEVASLLQRPADALERVDGEGDDDEHERAPARTGKPLGSSEEAADARAESGRPRPGHSAAR